MVFYVGVAELSVLFFQNGWTSSGLINSEEGVSYYKEGHETEYFQLKYNELGLGPEEPICVSVPLRNSTFQYVLYFKEFEDATKYITKMFCEYTSADVPPPLNENQ